MASKEQLREMWNVEVIIFRISPFGLALSGPFHCLKTPFSSIKRRHWHRKIPCFHVKYDKLCVNFMGVAFANIRFRHINPSWLPSFIIPNVQRLKLLSSPLCKPLPVWTVHRTLIASWNRVSGMILYEQVEETGKHWKNLESGQAGLVVPP